MAKQITRNTYKCVLCEQQGINSEFASLEAAENHEIKEHEIQWVPLEKKDVIALVNFIVTANDNANHAILTKRLMSTLYKFARV